MKTFTLIILLRLTFVLPFYFMPFRSIGKREHTLALIFVVFLRLTAEVVFPYFYHLVSHDRSIFLILSPYMEGKPDSNRKALTEAYKTLVNVKEGDVKEIDLRSVRSRTSHLRVPPPPAPPPPATPALYEQSQGNRMATNPSMATTTIKLMPTSAAVRLFSGNQSDYRSRQFILQCEDVMNNSFVSDPADKISFGRSRLEF